MGKGLLGRLSQGHAWSCNSSLAQERTKHESVREGAFLLQTMAPKLEGARLINVQKSHIIRMGVAGQW